MELVAKHTVYTIDEMRDFLSRSKLSFCLAMIVRNSASVILECLKSILPFLSGQDDTYIICDTGSEDNTCHLIDEFMAEHGVIGMIIHDTWKNYGENKTYLLEQIYKVCNQDVIFFLDDDEKFHTIDTDINNIKDDINKHLGDITLETRLRIEDEFISDPNFTILMMTTINGTSLYPRWQMMRNNQKYRWDFPFHEILQADVYIEKLITYMVNKHYGHKKVRTDSDRNKYHTYVQWGIEYLEKHPNNSRMLFYTAEAYRCIDDKSNAIKYYNKRIKNNGGYDQERYLSMLYLSRLYSDLGMGIETKVPILKRAIKEFPYRYEAYHDLVTMLRENNPLKSYMYGKQGIKNSVFNPRHLIYDKEIWDWKLIFETAISSYYCNKKSKGRAMIEVLLLQNRVPDYKINFVKEQLAHFPCIHGSGLWCVNNDKHNNVVIMDNVLNNPDNLREFALLQQFDVTGNYPGVRTKSFADDNHKAFFEKALGMTITYWPDGYNGSFQLITEDKKTWIHRDKTDYSAILYLTPDHLVKGDCGTTIYKNLLTNSTDEDELNKYTYDEKAWEIQDKIGYKYNRLVIFSGKRLSHMASGYCGNTPETGRLIQIFFFDAK